MPVQPVDLVKGCRINQRHHIRFRKEMAAAVQHESAIREARRILDVETGQLCRKFGFSCSSVIPACRIPRRRAGHLIMPIRGDVKFRPPGLPGSSPTCSMTFPCRAGEQTPPPSPTAPDREPASASETYYIPPPPPQAALSPESSGVVRSGVCATMADAMICLNVSPSPREI